MSVQWIKLDIGGVRTGRISMASLAAKGLWLEMLTLAAQSGEITSVPADARYLARQTGSTVDDVATAMAELVEIGSVELIDGAAHIYGSDSTKEDIARSRASSALRSKRHRETKSVKAEAEGEQSVGSIKARLWDAITKAIPDTLDEDEAVAVYQRYYEDAVKAGEPGGKYEPVKGIGPAVLANLVVSHAAARWLGLEAASPAHRRLAALRSTFGFAVIAAMPTAATKANGDPISYLQAILKKGSVK